MDQTQEPVQSSSKIDDEENMENERQEQVDVHCDIKEDYKYSNELHDFDSKQVRFEENGEGTENHVGNENGKDEHSTTENDIPKTNGVDEEEKDDDDDKDTPTPSGDDETEQQQQETPTAELDEGENEDEEDSQTTDNLDTTEESQRDSFAGSELSEDARPEEEENEKDIIQSLQKESQYDRTSSFSSLSVNIGSTQQDSDSELQISSRASPEGDIGEESFDRTSIDNEENFEEEEGEVDAEELEKDEDESEEKDESKEEREGRLVKQAHLDMALSLDTQEEPEDDDDKAAASEEPTSEDDTMATAEDDTMATANTGLEATKDKEEYVEEDEKDIEEEPKAETEKVPEVFVSFEKKDGEEEEVDESEQGEQEETKQEPVSKDDHNEHTKVKEFGRIFQDKNSNAKALYPKELATGEKSPVSVRRFKEIFEHGEPQLSPAAHGTVPEEECTSPRPGIVRNLRDLFENPKNFEWKETAKSTTVVN